SRRSRRRSSRRSDAGRDALGRGMRSEDKERAVVEVVARILAGAGDAKGVEAAVADTVFHETRRLEKEKRSRARDAALRTWEERKRRLVTESDAQTKRELLSEIATDFAREVLGNFDPRVYHYSTKLLPLMLSGLLNATSPLRILKSLP